MESMQRPDGRQTDPPLKDLLRHAKLRITGVRLSILRVLSASRVALDANAVSAAVAAAGDTADRVTVYRTLNTRVEAGIAHRVDPGDRVFRYSLTDHGLCTESHHEHEHPHMVCDRCGEVECIEDAEVVIKPKPAGTSGHDSTGSRRKFRITQQSVMLHGTCDRCFDDEVPRQVKSKPKLR